MLTRVPLPSRQMSGPELERAMRAFRAGQTQILLCTSIVESGLDIPNCNTIIITEVEKFGLAQIYQLRGRVGRSNVEAHAYLLYSVGNREDLSPPAEVCRGHMQFFVDDLALPTLDLSYLRYLTPSDGVLLSSVRLRKRNHVPSFRKSDGKFDERAVDYMSITVLILFASDCLDSWYHQECERISTHF